MEVAPGLRGLFPCLAEYGAVGVDAVLDESFRPPQLVVIEALHTGLPNHIVATDVRSFQVFGRRAADVAEEVSRKLAARIFAHRLGDHGNAREVFTTLKQEQRSLLRQIHGQYQLCTAVGIGERLQERAGGLVEKGGEIA